MIAGEGGFFTTPSGQRGAMLRAYDKATGKEVGAVYMPAPQTGSPMTYMLNGRQYLVVAISGGDVQRRAGGVQAAAGGHDDVTVAGPSSHEWHGGLQASTDVACGGESAHTCEPAILRLASMPSAAAVR